jgi:hypothetical protein
MESFTILLNLVREREREKEEFVGTVLTWDGVYLLEFGITIFGFFIIIIIIYLFIFILF